eukprot:SM014481S00830  [mRNA]  locus=s14481:50:298:- [translate_table: standard]
MEDVVRAVRPDFQAEGVDDSVLHELHMVRSRRRRRVAGFGAHQWLFAVALDLNWRRPDGGAAPAPTNSAAATPLGALCSSGS